MAATPSRLYAPNAILTTIAAASLQNLANNTSVLGTEYDNTPAAGTGSLGDVFGWMLFTLKYNSVTGIAAGTRVADIYLLPALDGTNYPTQAGSPSIPGKSLYVGSLESRAPSTTVVEYLALPPVRLPPCKLKVLFANVCGQSLKNDTSCLAQMLMYQFQIS